MNEKNNGLPTILKSAREYKALTLRDVEQATGVSNAYLSQLEKGKIQQPSPTILHKLAQVYGLSYSDLLELAGYPLPTEEDEKSTSELSERLGPITPEEEEALIDYLKFFRMRKRKGGNDE